MKRPYLQLYVADWQSNAKLRLCSHGEKGIWLDVMCILHDQDEYGIVRWPLKQIAQAVHASVSSLNKLASKGIIKGADAGATCGALTYTPRSGRQVGPTVTLVEAQPGPIWYSSRMVRDEYLRMARGEFSTDESRSPKGGMGAGKNSPPLRARASSSHSQSSSSSESRLNTSETRSINSKLEGHTHNGGEKTVCVTQSRFSLEQIRGFAWASYRLSQKVVSLGNKQSEGIRNPEGWAIFAHRSGEFDELIQEWVDDPKIFNMAG